MSSPISYTALQSLHGSREGLLLSTLHSSWGQRLPPLIAWLYELLLVQNKISTQSLCRQVSQRWSSKIYKRSKICYQTQRRTPAYTISQSCRTCQAQDQPVWALKSVKIFFSYSRTVWCYRVCDRRGTFRRRYFWVYCFALSGQSCRSQWLWKVQKDYFSFTLNRNKEQWKRAIIYLLSSINAPRIKLRLSTDLLPLVNVSYLVSDVELTVENLLLDLPVLQPLGIDIKALLKERRVLLACTDCFHIELSSALEAQVSRLMIVRLDLFCISDTAQS